MTFHPFKLAFWLFVGGISFGMSLGWGWLVLLGLFAPLVLLMFCAVWPFFQQYNG